MGMRIEDRVVPVTLPPLPWLETARQQDHELTKELKAQLAEHRIIRAGLDAWRLIHKAESFESWKAIGAALSVGRVFALRVTGANAPCGRNYSWTFSAWCKDNGFGGMAKSVRSVAIELHENIVAIEAWRATLPERERKRLIHPLSVTRRWRAHTQHNGGKCPQDLKRDAVAAWRRFLDCVKGLPADQAAPLWAMVRESARIMSAET
jgi:hypothetical protein